MGSPSVASERIQSGEHLYIAGRELARYCGVSEFCATLWYVKNFFEDVELRLTISFYISVEIGGSNGMQSLRMSKSIYLCCEDGSVEF